MSKLDRYVSLVPTATGGLEKQNMPIDNGFPEEEANRLARVESYNKHLYRPNTYTHKWWARRSGVVFRYILKQLVSNQSSRDYYAPGGLEGLVVMDPMMGGGTTIHEAIRMGANVVGADVDPIPIVQAKTALRHAPLEHRKSVFSDLVGHLGSGISHLYTTECPMCNETAVAQYFLYGLRRLCGCREVLQIDSRVLRREQNSTIQVCPLCWEVYVDEPHRCHRPKRERTLVERTQRRCGLCGTAFDDVPAARFTERYQAFALSGTCPEHGQFMKSVDEEDDRVAAEAEMECKHSPSIFRERHDVSGGPKSADLLRRGVRSYDELFTSRQLLYLKRSIDFVRRSDDADRMWLALLISTSLEFNCLLCGYKGADLRRPGAIRHVFSHHAYTFPYTALENNPISENGGSGTLNRIFEDRIVRASAWAQTPTESRSTNSGMKKVEINGEVDFGSEVEDWADLKAGTRRYLLVQGDSGNLGVPEGLVDYVVTDPPYYDNVQYGDLSEFFRVWLSEMLPDQADWRYDIRDAAVASNGNGKSNWYADTMTRIWATCRRSLKTDGRLIFTFHHWKPAAWAELTISLKRAGFELVNAYAVHSENPISVHIRDLKALSHDAILVLKARTDGGSRWTKPGKVEVNDSYMFCRECSAALGWYLEDTCGESEILEGWNHLIGGE